MSVWSSTNIMSGLWKNQTSLFTFYLKRFWHTWIQTGAKICVYVPKSAERNCWLIKAEKHAFTSNTGSNPLSRPDAQSATRLLFVLASHHRFKPPPREIESTTRAVFISVGLISSRWMLTTSGYQQNRMKRTDREWNQHLRGSPAAVRRLCLLQLDSPVDGNAAFINRTSGDERKNAANMLLWERGGAT